MRWVELSWVICKSCFGFVTVTDFIITPGEFYYIRLCLSWLSLIPVTKMKNWVSWVKSDRSLWTRRKTQLNSTQLDQCQNVQSWLKTAVYQLSSVEFVAIYRALDWRLETFRDSGDSLCNVSHVHAPTQPSPHREVYVDLLLGRINDKCPRRCWRDVYTWPDCASRRHLVEADLLRCMQAPQQPEAPWYSASLLLSVTLAQLIVQLTTGHFELPACTVHTCCRTYSTFFKLYTWW